MPGSTDEPLELSIMIVYDSLKQIQIDSGRLDAVATLRSDLSALGVPQPKRDNIAFVSGGVKFFWISYKNSTLHRRLIREVRKVVDDWDLRERQISSWSLKETFIKDRSASHSTSKDLKKLPKPRSQVYSSSGGQVSTSAGMAAGSTSSPSMDIDMKSLHHEFHGSFQSSSKNGDVTKSQVPRRDSIASSVASNALPPIAPHPQILNSSSTAPRNPRKRGRSHGPDDEPELSSRTTSMTVDHLTRELWAIRRQILADIRKETDILGKLRELDAPLASQPESNEYVIKARLEMVEKELLDEKRRRAEAESALEDVERECREPFVVPALLQAFVSISRLTTEALNFKS